MFENLAPQWNKDTLRSLRLRMGWSKSDIAHRLHCSVQDVEAWEEGRQQFTALVRSELEFLQRQAESVSEEVLYTPAAESQCDKKALDQIDFSQVKAELD